MSEFFGLEIRTSPHVPVGKAVVIGRRIAYVHPTDKTTAEHIAALPVVAYLPESRALVDELVEWARAAKT